MKTVRIGRTPNNDVVVNDPCVSRVSHCIIMLDDGGNYKIIDNSKNGTFVNGNRIGYGSEMRLQPMDVVRIGNSTLPWQTYFRDCKQEKGGTEIYSGAIGVGGASCVRFGRAQDNDVVLADNTVSSHHMTIKNVNGVIIIEDLRSTNGTFVNGRRITEPTPLNAGDSVSIGKSSVNWSQYMQPAAPVSSGSTNYVGSYSEVEEEEEKRTATALQVTALILSLIGLGFMAYVGIALATSKPIPHVESILLFIGGGVSIVAAIIASIALYLEESDKDGMATWADWIAGICITAAIVILLITDAGYFNGTPCRGIPR